MSIIELHEWEERSPQNDILLAGYALDNDPAVREAARQFTQFGMLEVVELRQGLLLRSTSFVGRVRLGSLEVVIRPKIPIDPLLSLLRYAYQLRDLRLLANVAHSALPEAFQDLLIQQLAAEAAELLARGLQRKYVQVSEPLPAPRGKLDMQRIARQGGVSGTTIPCTYYPRLEDSLINQVVLAGMYFAAKLTTDTALKTSLRRLASRMEDSVSRIALNKGAMQRVFREMNRLTAAYKPALTIIALLLEATGIALDGETSFQLPGFLFDMNRFFEALMSRFLRENLAGYTVHDQYRLHGMMAYNREHNPRHRQAPTPRPDYVISQGGKMVAMLDAKYRDIWNKDLPQNMLYQLAIYALSQGAGGQATILYPTTDSNARLEVIDIREIFRGEHCGKVVLRPVNLLQLEQLVTSQGVQAERKRAQFATYLALGSTPIPTV